MPHKFLHYVTLFGYLKLFANKSQGMANGAILVEGFT